MIADFIAAVVEEALVWWLDRRGEKRRTKNEKKDEDTHEDR